jgi:hypothetical protein
VTDPAVFYPRESNSERLRGGNTHKQLEELEDPLVCEDVEGITADRVDDGQPVDLILDQRIHSVVDTGREREFTAS